MPNERKTENIVRDELRRLSYYTKEHSTRVEEQKSEIESVKRLLKSASKSGKGGKGSPEFIISDSSTPDFLVVVECKADIKHHESTDRNDPVGYAVDGVLHYAAQRRCCINAESLPERVSFIRRPCNCRACRGGSSD